jgi:YHS domain-containing protein
MSRMPLKPVQIRTDHAFAQNERASWRRVVSTSLIVAALAALAGLSVPARALAEAPMMAVAAPATLAPIDVVADPLTGRALFGHDAVAYFIDQMAIKGRDDVMFHWAGADWHFASVENCERFRANPAAYAPMFAGYDPLRLLKSNLVAADPRLFAVREGKLWFFRDQDARQAFLDDPSIEIAARKNWERLIMDTATRPGETVR